MFKIQNFDRSVSTVKYKLWRFGWTFYNHLDHADSFTLIDSHGTWRGLFGKVIFLTRKSK